MVKAGAIICNPVTGERAIIRTGTAETYGERIVCELWIRPGGAVVGEHSHPGIIEKFTVLEGVVGFSIQGKKFIGELNREITVNPNELHDWWNAGTVPARVLVDVTPGQRFESMIRNMFGLAIDGKTDSKGMPGFVQLIMTSREFRDVIVVTRAPAWMVSMLYLLLKPVAWLTGIEGSYERYEQAPPSFFTVDDR
jgi:quercetin dioxygenase-like cupin family protein